MNHVWKYQGTRRNAYKATGFGALLAATAWLAPSTANAGPMRLALDLNYAAGIDEPGVDSGMGGAIRFGRKLDLILVSLTPEVGGSYHAFAGPADLTHTAGLIGARLALGKVLEPGVFTHIGVGHISGDGFSDTGTAFDAGVTLDLTILPFIDLGVHAAYDALWLKGENSFDWYDIGIHAALAF